jgi:hypothetical protein
MKNYSGYGCMTYGCKMYSIPGQIFLVKIIRRMKNCLEEWSCGVLESPNFTSYHWKNWNGIMLSVHNSIIAYQFTPKRSVGGLLHQSKIPFLQDSFHSIPLLI